jgi:hypothetical protein
MEGVPTTTTPERNEPMPVITVTDAIMAEAAVLEGG